MPTLPLTEPEIGAMAEKARPDASESSRRSGNRGSRKAGIYYQRLVEKGVTMKGPLSFFSEEEFCSFLCHLGNLVFNSVPTAAFARHKNPRDTVRDYFDIGRKDTSSEGMAGVFLKDYLDRNFDLDTMSQKWFGMSSEELAAQTSERLAEIRKSHSPAIQTRRPG